MKGGASFVILGTRQTGAYPGGGVLRVLEHPPNFQSGYFPTPHLNIYPSPFKGWCMGCMIDAVKEWTMD